MSAADDKAAAAKKAADAAREKKVKKNPWLLSDDLGVMSLEDVLSQEAESDQLRNANLRLLKALEKTKKAQTEYSAVLYEAVVDATSGLKLKPVPKPKADKRQKAEEVAVAIVSDWQLAKTTPSYNSEVCEERIEAYAQKVIELTEIQRADHPVRECHLWVLGDIIEGELIFPGQHWLIDASLYRQVCVDGPRIMIGLIQTLLTTFEKVVITAVDGNHGRIGGRSSRDMHPESNGDRMLYTICQQLLKDEPRVEWHIAESKGEKNWYAIAEVGNYKSMLIHGDQIRGGFAGFPFYGLAKKIWGWKAGAIPETFQDLYMGHYHQNTKVTLNNCIARCNGSTESYNTFAQEVMGAMGRASQSLMFVHPEKGEVTAEYQVWLTSEFYGEPIEK